MVTIRQIADECKVSMATVSNVLNGRKKTSLETERKVMEVVNKYGYRPNSIAQGLRRKSTRVIGIIAEDLNQFTTPEIVEGVMGYCEEQGYQTFVSNLRMYARWADTWFYNENALHSVLDPALQEMQSTRVEGILYIAGHGRNVRCFPDDFQIPSVVAYAYAEDPGVPSVVIDDENSAFELMNLLLKAGHTEIGVVAGLPDNLHTQKRLLGIQRALFEWKIPYDPSLIRYCRWNADAAHEQCDYLIREKQVSAVFCMCDRMAGGVYRYLYEHGKVPGKDISVTGFDNQDIAEYFVPPLTTTALPLREIGRRAAELLFERIREESGEDDRIKIEKEYPVPCELKERDSIGEPR